MKAVVLLSVLLAIAGCAADKAAITSRDASPSNNGQSPAADPQARETVQVMARGEAAERTGRIDFWMSKPATVVVEADDFDALFSACEEAARDFLFRIDRSDRRSGRILTVPMTSAQFFEFLRRDVQTLRDLLLSSTATYRRTLVFDISRNAVDRYEASPKVVVERLSRAERRITSVVLYRSVFGRRTASREVARGSREADAGVRLPEEYWYAVSRDEALERAVAERVRSHISDAGTLVRAAGDR
jgi:hypothetical protein